jgi:F-type H+-transporting ATPase subunit b
MVSVTIDASLIWQIINFLILLPVLYIFLFKPILKIIQDREAYFDTLRLRASQAKASFEEGEARSLSARAEALTSGLSSQAAGKAQAQAQEREILAKAQEEASARLEEARRELSAAVETARQELKGQAGSIGAQMASRLLGRELPT